MHFDAGRRRPRGPGELRDACEPAIVEAGDDARPCGVDHMNVPRASGHPHAALRVADRFELVQSCAGLEQALGKQRYDDLMAGREIVLDNGQRFALR